MFFTALNRLRRGALATVFDATDRVQHMFWRYHEDGHPAAAGADPGPYRRAIEDYYERNDALVGRVLDRLDDDDLLLVLSDHGFTSFRRGVNLNAWLLANGYLHLKEEHDGSEAWLGSVDWSKTRAYAVGLVGIFLNVRGREAHGIVEPGDEAASLKAELAEKLRGLRDSERDEVAVNEAFDTDTLYNGPYKGNAPDLLIGYNHGYRISWDGASGIVAGPVFSDNVKAWSGDHIVDPRLVPGVLFSSRPVEVDDPAIIDLAPTILAMFGVRPAPHMEGRVLFGASRHAS
jgi:predicted AlkP superfamily phosphohydrolase/phosphomutase